MYKKYTRKQEFIIITFILLLALVSTYFIYNKFSEERKIDYNSDSLEIVFSDSTGDKINIKKVTPLNDSVGMSTKAYNFSIRNNLTETKSIKIILEDDQKTIKKDNCEDKLMPKDNLKAIIKYKDEESDIKRLSELEEGVLLEAELKPVSENNFTIRIWVDKDTLLTPGSDFHYHGKIKVIEEDTSIVINN